MGIVREIGDYSEFFTSVLAGVGQLFLASMHIQGGDPSSLSRLGSGTARVQTVVEFIEGY